MSTDDREPEAAVSVTDAPEESPAGEPARRLEIEVAITDAGPCKKHLKITIPRSEIERQYEQSLESLRQEAVVPGFRPGRAPRQLVVKRFRKQVSEQVKSKLLMSSLEQIDKDYKLEPIVQPRLDVEAIEIPEQGPMNFEMDVEVRPQFDAPSYKGLRVKRPVVELTEQDVDAHLTRYLERHGQIVPKLEGAAEIGDYLIADLIFLRPDGRIMNEVKETQFRLQSELRFQNGTIPDIGSKLSGARPGDTREVEARLGSAVDDPALRGATIRVQIRVNDLKRIRLPEVNQTFLESIDFQSSDQLREAVREALERRIRSEQRQAIRRQILDVLLRETPFDLPADLVSREEKSTIARLVAQLRQEGMTDTEIRASEAQIRANAHESTLRSLKELLLLSKIAEAEDIKVQEEDIALELESIAERTGESVRRVRARIEKEDGAESLTTQILERRVIDRILEDVEIEDVATRTESGGDVETLDHTAAAADESEAAQSAPQPSENPDQES
jgi:trigger factor